ncbi:MAG: dependent oxidoreductase, partial [Paenibacillus sp.]|nr:dependent oxidoreductase [Paenibacillus sp.]
MRAYNNSDASADWGGQRLQRRIRKPPALGAYDAIVAGGGVGGCAAAVKLAREGARVALLESSGVLGWEIVRARQTRIDLPGLSEQSQAAAQLAERIAARNGCFGDTVDPVATALAIDDWIIGAGVEPLLHT